MPEPWFGIRGIQRTAPRTHAVGQKRTSVNVGKLVGRSRCSDRSREQLETSRT